MRLKSGNVQHEAVRQYRKKGRIPLGLLDMAFESGGKFPYPKTCEPSRQGPLLVLHQDLTDPRTCILWRLVLFRDTKLVE